MPSWKRVITSGSNAVLNNVTASFFTGSFIGNGSQLTGITTASFVTGSIFSGSNSALSSSYALTASYALNSAGGSGFPFTGTASISGALVVTGSTFTNDIFLRGTFANSRPTLKFGTGAGSSPYPYGFFVDAGNNLVLNVATGSIFRNTMAVTPGANIIWNCEDFVRFAQGTTTLINATPATVTIDVPTLERQSNFKVIDSTFLGISSYNEGTNTSVHGIGNHAEGKNTQAGTGDYTVPSFPFYTTYALTFTSNALQPHQSQSWFTLNGDDRLLTNLNIVYDSTNLNSFVYPSTIPEYETRWSELQSYVGGTDLNFAFKINDAETCTYVDSNTLIVSGDKRTTYEGYNIYAIELGTDTYLDNYYESNTVSSSVYNSGPDTTTLSLVGSLTYNTNRIVLESLVDTNVSGIYFGSKDLIPLSTSLPDYTGQIKLAIDSGNTTGSVLFAPFTVTSGSTKYQEIQEDQAVSLSSITQLYLNSAGYSHVEGLDSSVVGGYSHVAGIGLVGSGSGQTVVGKYNANNNTSSLFVIGGGANSASRADVFTVDSNRINIERGFKYSVDRDNVNSGVTNINPSCSIFCVTHGSNTTVRLPDVNTIPLGTTYYIKSIGGIKFGLTSSNSNACFDHTNSTFWNITGSSAAVAPAVQVAYLLTTGNSPMWGILSVWNGVTSSIVA